MFVREDYPKRIISHFSPSQRNTFQPANNAKAIDAWENSLRQSHIDADIVFFGDSITRRGHFDAFFPDKTICNLGLGSDTIAGMIDRVSMISAVSPETVFVMGGINSLRDNTLEATIDEYTTMLSNISDNCAASVYVISVLPISEEKASEIGCSSDTIQQFNESIKDVAKNIGFVYIDLFNKFSSSSGFILDKFTTDGVHLTEDGYNIWADEIRKFIN